MTLPVKFGRPAYQLYRFMWTGLDWLYPPHCGGCGQRGLRWCPDCRQQVQRLLPPCCPTCGRGQAGGKICPECSQASYQFNAVRSVYYYEGPIREAIQRLKYKGDMGLGEALAEDMIDLFCMQSWIVDIVIPVPIESVRRKERGYNQASLLAVPLALAVSIQYESKALKKTRQTRSQVGLTRDDRIQNVSGSFQADAKIISNRRVLIIDDVMTTGATLDACAEALYQAGAKDIYCLTLARARDHQADLVTQSGSFRENNGIYS